MAMKKTTTLSLRKRRHHRVRAKISGTAARPRVAVFRSNKYCYAQLIDDERGMTLLAVSDAAVSGKNKTERAKTAGEKLGKRMQEFRMITAVFDRGGYAYHGRVKALAEGLRQSGITI